MEELTLETIGTHFNDEILKERLSNLQAHLEVNHLLFKDINSIMSNPDFFKDQPDQFFFNKSFPIAFLVDGRDKKNIKKMGIASPEFRTDSLTIGRDIKIIASPKEHANEVRNFLKHHQLGHVIVCDLDTLNNNISTMDFDKLSSGEPIYFCTTETGVGKEIPSVHHPMSNTDSYPAATRLDDTNASYAKREEKKDTTPSSKVNDTTRHDDFNTASADLIQKLSQCNTWEYIPSLRVDTIPKSSDNHRAWEYSISIDIKIV